LHLDWAGKFSDHGNIDCESVLYLRVNFGFNNVYGGISLHDLASADLESAFRSEVGVVPINEACIDILELGDKLVERNGA
jgi:hypothetical protein